MSKSSIDRLREAEIAVTERKKQLSDELSSEHYAVGVKNGNTELAQKITDTLKAMNEDGTVKQLCEKYADYGLSYENWILK